MQSIWGLIKINIKINYAIFVSMLLVNQLNGNTNV